VFYSLIFNKSPLAISAFGGKSAGLKNWLRSAAKRHAEKIGKQKHFNKFLKGAFLIWRLRRPEPPPAGQKTDF